MKCSVVMSTYNGKKYIVEQLDSIRCQSRTPDEVIIFDDCSTDDTYEIIEEYVQKYSLTSWKLYSRNVNIGYIKSFSKALSLATTDVIFLADQDDVWERNKISVCLKIMEKHPQILALNTSFSLIDDDNNPLAERKLPLTSNNGWIVFQHIKEGKIARIKKEKVLLSNISPGCTLAIKKDLLSDYFEFKDGSVIPHDWKLNYLAARKNNCYFLNRPMIKYRLHSSNTIGMENENILSRDYRIKAYKEHITGYVAFKNAFLEENEYTDSFLIRKCKRKIRYYELRIKALQDRSYLRIIFATIYGIVFVGLEGVTTLMDVTSLKK